MPISLSSKQKQQIVVNVLMQLMPDDFTDLSDDEGNSFAHAWKPFLFVQQRWQYKHWHFVSLGHERGWT